MDAVTFCRRTVLATALVAFFSADWVSAQPESPADPLPSATDRLPADAGGAPATLYASATKPLPSINGCRDCVGQFFMGLWGLEREAVSLHNCGSEKAEPKSDDKPACGDDFCLECFGNQKKKKKGPPKPYKGLFYLNDFRYLDNPDNKYFDSFDFLKRNRPGCCDLVIDVGGEFRYRGNVFDNQRLNGRTNSFNLYRNRLYIDAWYADRFRVYAEYLDAVSFHENLPPLPIDENRSDLLNLFGEVKLWSQGNRSLSLRYGRQELLYGAERLISPLDWANTRRTFDEVATVVYRSSGWDVDAFWGRPVFPDTRNFDHGDQSRQFGGFYSTYKGMEDQTFDFYFLALLESDAVTVGNLLGSFEVYTVGGRWYGEWCDWLWEVEGAYQFGFQNDRGRSLDLRAGMFTVGCGRRFSEWHGKPQIWFYYDWASGDEDPFDNRYTTFNQLFPLGHKYFGFIDLVARQNIRDPNAILKWSPHKRLALLLWYHRFFLAKKRDALYNAAGVPIRRDLTGQAGNDVGQEIDFLATVHVNPHTDVQIGYSYFFAGSFIEQTGFGGDVDFFYLTFQFRF